MKPIRITQTDVYDMLKEAKQLQEKQIVESADITVKMNNGKSIKMTGKEIAEALSEAVKKRVAEKKAECAEMQAEQMLESYRKAKAKAKRK